MQLVCLSYAQLSNFADYKQLMLVFLLFAAAVGRTCCAAFGTKLWMSSMNSTILRDDSATSTHTAFSRSCKQHQHKIAVCIS
jgi:hypothetical protein